MKALQELDLLFHKIQDIRNSLEVSENISLEDLINIADSSTELISIVEVKKYSLSIVHNNKNANDFIMLTNNESVNLGFNFFTKVLHPENIGSIYLMIKFFSDKNNKHKKFSNTYFVNSKDGWQWLYNSIKPVTFNQDGSVKYMMSVSCTLNDCSDNKEQRVQLKKNLNFYEENIEKYLSMTNREKEVLKLIADERTGIEIADFLSISPITVETDRKNLIKKFDVKNSVGLAKYALHFKMV